MLNRDDKGRLVFQSLDLQIFIGDMFAKCKTEHEIEWVQEQLTSCIECESEQRLDELEEDKQ